MPERVVFMGTPAFAVPSLRALVDAGYDVVLVVTQPDRPKGRSGEPVPPPVKVFATSFGLRVFQPERLKDEAAIREILATSPDVIVTAAYGQIVPRPLLEGPPFGAINVHASLLPKYRGAAPVAWALIRGETKTGVTIVKMVEALDAGPILAQRETSIYPHENAAILEARLAEMGAALLVETLPRYFRGEIEPVPQNEAEKSFAPLLKKEDGALDFQLSAQELVWRVRGLTPWPGAFFSAFGERILVYEAQAEDEGPFAGASPGTIVELADVIRIRAGKGVFVVRRLKPEGRREMTAAEFLRGRKTWKVGAQVDPPPPRQTLRG